MVEIDQSAPILVFTGQAGNETAQFYVCCEQGVLLEAKTVKDAIIDLTAAYYVFDITYPKGVDGILLFFQHFVFGLKRQQVVPLPALKLISNLNKIA